MRWPVPMLVALVVACSASSPAPVPLAAAPLVPAALTPSTADVVQLAVGNAHTCARHADGAVSCWGANDHGQLGVAQLERSLYPIAVHHARGAVELAAAEDMTCVRRAAGGVACWGAIEIGTGTGFGLGIGAPVAKRFEPARVADGIVQLAGRCFLRGDGAVACLSYRAQVVAVAGIEDAVEIASWGDDRGCAIRRDRTVRCWTGGRLHDLGVTDVVAVSANASELCALRADGELKCWLVITPDRLTPAPGRAQRGVRGLVAGPAQRCARTERGLVCVVDGSERVFEVAAGAPVAVGAHGCFVARGRDVRCWGHGLAGQLGNGWWQRRPAPALVPGLEDVVELGGAHERDWACARRRDGTLACWGTFPAADAPVPRALPIRDVRALVAAAPLRVLGADRRLYELVDDGRGDPEVPVRFRAIEDAVAGASVALPIDDAVEVAASETARCAIRSDRSLWCWAVTRERVEPGAIDVGGPVVTMSMARDAMCVVRANGTIACWGANQDGQLGDGTFDARAWPADVRGIVDAIDVHVGNRFACALHRSGRVSCWGATASGQVGTYATADVRAPAAVVWP